MGVQAQGRRFLSGIWRKRSKAAVSLILAVTLLLTGIPFVPGPSGKPGVAHADTSLRVEPNRFNPAKGEKAALLFSFNEADAGAISHPTVIGIARMNPAGGFPTIAPEDILHQEDYPVYDGNGQIKVNRFEWDGTRNGVPVPAGRYLLCVNPTGFDHGGTFYGYVAAVDVEYGDQPKAPASVKLEREAAGGGLVLRGIAETGTRVSVQVWGQDGTADREITDITVGATGQWSTPLALAQDQIFSITAAAEKNGQVSPYSEMVRALSYEVPASGQITWENVAGYYYKEDNVAQLVRDARTLAADNGVTASEQASVQADSRVTVSAQADSLSYAVPVAAGSRVLIKEPLADGALAPADAGQFTAAAVAARKIGLRPGGGAGPVDPATGGFIFGSKGLSLQGLPSLSFSVSYSSRDAFEGAMGPGWRHSYDWRITAGEEGKRELSLPDGSEYEFIPLNGGRYLSPKGMNLELSAQAGGMLSLRYPDGSAYVFTADGKPAEFADANGNKVTFVYTGGQLAQMVTGGASLALGYEGDRLVSVADQSGRSVAYTYDSGGHLANMRLADGAVYSMTYDGNGRVSSLTRPETAAALTVSYDDEGRVTGYTDELGSRTEVTYKVINGDDGGGDDGGSGSGDTTISTANRRDIPESDKVLLSGTMGNERNAPAYLQVEGLKEAITPYMEKQKSDIGSKLAAYEAAAVSGGSSVTEINRAIGSWSGAGPAIVKAGGLNLEEGATFGSPSRPVVLIVEGINTNQPLQITVYGTLIVKGSLNANTKLSVAAHTAGSGTATAGNLWVMGPVHLNNDSSLQIENQLYAGTLTYNNGLLNVAASRVLVDGNLNINTKVDMTIREEMAVGEIVSNNQTANLTVEDGDLFVREQVSVNNHLSVATGGLFAVGGSFTPNQRPMVRTGVGSGHTLLKYKTSGVANAAVRAG